MAPHIHPDRDQWMSSSGAQKNFVEFDADVEIFTSTMRVDGKSIILSMLIFRRG
jgi:hypothetical protein